MNATLLILAAGLGSRYGSTKQIDSFGPGGECIADYSIYDAMKAGFTKVVFVIRQEMKPEMEKIFLTRWQNKIDIEFAIQAMDYPKHLFTEKTIRTKPWGTAHAVMCAKDYINQPFAVINADDFYGADAYNNMMHFFDTNKEPHHYAMAGYKLENTLSAFGGVSRGICLADNNNMLLKITERKNIVCNSEKKIVANDNLIPEYLINDDFVSMNFWGFKPAVFFEMEKMFAQFIHTHLPNDEFYLPQVAQHIIDTQNGKIKILPTNDKWFGVTYSDDKQLVTDSLLHLTENKIYPSPLWK
nr:nucleotidyltransferase [Bacteroidota bacterium]